MESSSYGYSVSTLVVFQPFSQLLTNPSVVINSYCWQCCLTYEIVATSNLLAFAILLTLMKNGRACLKNVEMSKLKCSLANETMKACLSISSVNPELEMFTCNTKGFLTMMYFTYNLHSQIPAATSTLITKKVRKILQYT